MSRMAELLDQPESVSALFVKFPCRYDSLVVIAFTHGVMGRQIDPSCSSQCSMTGVTKAVIYAVLSVRWCI